MQYVYHTDPSHGWVEVPLAEINRLKLTPSLYSHIRGAFAYLEEDCDFSAWAHAKRAADEPYQLVTRNVNHDHPIRNYKRFGA